MPQLRSFIAATALALAAASCTVRPDRGVLIPTNETVADASQVRVLAATTRQRSFADAGEMFNGERADGISYAAITVSIPPDSARKVGEIQWPASFPGDPSRDFVTTSAEVIDKQRLSAAVTARARMSGQTKALVFVHGFNNRFDDAVYRLAQIVHDAKAPGIPVLFTWPSRGEIALRAYTYDRESANYSRDALEEVLDMLAANPNITEINILAHSMGNWVALEALRTMSVRARRIDSKVRFVMLVAPDVDVDVFKSQIRRMGEVRPKFLLFVSKDDRALSLAQTLWGGVPRLGEVDPLSEPYLTEFAKAQIEVFDLTGRKGGAHDRAFEDVTSVKAMIAKRLSEGQQLTNREPSLTQ
jgi:esterase/lipase superfamily enzyme